MMTYIIAYGIVTLIFFLLDFLWLGVIAKNFYADQLGNMMLDSPKLGIAAVFYMSYTIGIVVFAIKPALENDSVMNAVLYAALFGFLAYGTYDFTNMATLKRWPVKMSIVDLCWGTTVTVISAATTYLIMKKTGL